MSARFVFLWAVLVMILYLAASRVQRTSHPPAETPSSPAAGERTTPKVEAAPSERAAPPVEVRRHQPSDTRVADFQRAAREALAQLPRERKQDAGDAHHPPIELVTSGDKIGQLIDRMLGDNALVPEGIAFFDACARDAGAHAASRAVCLHYLRHWSRRAGKPVSFGAGDIPAEIARLADRLPSLDN